MAKQFNFCFVRRQDMSLEIKIFAPLCICKHVNVQTNELIKDLFCCILETYSGTEVCN